MRINTMLSLLLVAICVTSAKDGGIRNWPHPGFDPQHSRFQSDQDLQVPLCGIAQYRNPFTTTATQTVVYDGAQYYSKSGTASVFAFNLVNQSTTWRVADLVTKVLDDPTKTGANLTSPIFVAIVSDPPHDYFLFTYFTLGTNNSHTNEKVVALLNISGGDVLFKTNKTTGRSDSEALGVTIHYDLSLALLTSAESLSALPLPFNNATREAFDSFSPIWERSINGSRVQTPLVLKDTSRLAFLYPSHTLSVLKAATGDVEFAFTDFGEAENLVFGLGNVIALSGKTGGFLANYATKDIVPLEDTYPLAVASNTTDYVAFRQGVHPEPNMLVKLSTTTNGTGTWSVQINVTAPVAASVDWKGVVYVIGSGGEFPLQAFGLATGNFLWQMVIPTNESNIASPIIASSDVNSTYLFVDSPAGQYVFSPSCAGECNEKEYTCSCKEGTYGAACSVSCSTNSTCNGHGTCNYAGGCDCESNYYLSDCSVRCEMKKDCFNGKCHPDGSCHCDTNWYSMKCNQFCTPNHTCNSVGTCDVDGNCSCPVGGWFVPRIRVPPYCAEGANFAMIGIIIAIIGIGGMCIGLCLCYCCEKSRKELPKNPAKLSLLKHKH